MTDGYKYGNPNYTTCFVGADPRIRMISNDPITQRLQLTKIALEIAIKTFTMSETLANYLEAEVNTVEQVLEEYCV